LTDNQERWLVGIMLSVTLVKLALAIYCRTFKNEIVKAYAQDHFFDVITNSIGLIAALLAKYFDDWMDPVGAIIVRDSLSLCLSKYMYLGNSAYVFMPICFSLILTNNMTFLVLLNECV
jgi:hypothetical protein